MSTIDLTLPDFLRAENRGLPSQARKRRAATSRVVPKSAGEKAKRRRTQKLEKADVKTDR